MKRILAAAALLLSIAVCGQNNNKKMAENKTLVAWFGWSQNTETMAKYIAGKTPVPTFSASSA